MSLYCLSYALFDIAVPNGPRTARKGITQSIVDNFMFKLKESPDPAMLQATSNKSVSSEGVPELASMHQMSLTYKQGLNNLDEACGETFIKLQHKMRTMEKDSNENSSQIQKVTHFMVSAAESSILNEEETSELIGVLTNNADLFIEATGEWKFHEEFPNNWSIGQWEDEFCVNFCRYLALNQSSNESKLTEATLREAKIFVLADENQLYQLKFSNNELWQLVLPLKHCKLILEYYHDFLLDCQLLMIKTLSMIQDKYWWPLMGIYVQNWVRSCKIFQAVKENNSTECPLNSIKSGKMIDLIAIDVLQLPETESKNK
uniref:Integrase zinc-binding domain-containing protein n=1 Tax=Romanomermis culicivorax TaxID=13658 RepID=A0A915KTQ0_ROMCU